MSNKATMGRGFWTLAALMATAVATYGQHHVEPPEEIEYEPGDRVDRTVTPPNGTVLSGSQVVGLDWAWTGSQNGAHWSSVIPQQQAHFHLTRFEGKWKRNTTPGGGGGKDAPPPTPTWEMDVPVKGKCNWYKFETLPPQTPAKLFAPTHKDSPDPKPYRPPLGATSWDTLLKNICLELTPEGPVMGKFLFRGVMNVDFIRQSQSSIPCAQCGQTARQYVYVLINFADTWETEIKIAQWKDRTENYVTDIAKAAWLFYYNRIEGHEPKHKVDFDQSVVQPLNNSYLEMHKTYTFSFCLEAIKDNIEHFKVILAHNKRECDKFDAMVTQCIAKFKEQEKARDTKDYPGIRAQLRKFLQDTYGVDLGGFPLAQ